MRISDWSSDVCSSDLDPRLVQRAADHADDPRTGADQVAQWRAPGVLHEPDAALVPAHAGGGEDRGVHPGLRQHRRQADAELLRGSGERSEENTSELQSLMRNSYASFCWKNKTNTTKHKGIKYDHNNEN